jgi:pimeloyl-ACP methyl ester carboxylesterase
MNLYLISGLGADKRVFQKLALPPEFTIHYIEWTPVSDEDTLADYCSRLTDQIDQSVPFSLIGVSFGGIIAIEISKISRPVQTVIISSFSCKAELSSFYLILNKLGLHRFIPVRLLLKPNNFLYRIFGVFQPDGKNLLKNILYDTDPKFFSWAINQLINWENNWKPLSFLHIHGTADKILPYKKNMHAIPVTGGAHLMVYSRAGEVSQILEEKLRLA